MDVYILRRCCENYSLSSSDLSVKQHTTKRDKDQTQDQRLINSFSSVHPSTHPRKHPIISSRNQESFYRPIARGVSFLLHLETGSKPSRPFPPTKGRSQTGHLLSLPLKPRRRSRSLVLDLLPSFSSFLLLLLLQRYDSGQRT